MPVYGGWIYGEPRECDEGALEWVEINKVEELDLWEGDKIFSGCFVRTAPFLLKTVLR